MSAAAACSIGSDGYELKWSEQSWTATSVSESFTVTRPGTTAGQNHADPVQIDFTITDPSGALSALSNPSISGDFEGGYGAATQSLDLEGIPSVPGSIEINLSFDMPIESLTIPFFDLDTESGSYPETLTAYGNNNSEGGGPYTPVLSTPYDTAQEVTGPESTLEIDPGAGRAYTNGRGLAADKTTDNGNVSVTFSEPVDTVVISFKWSTPGVPYEFAMHDLEFCTARTPNLIASKTMRVHSETPDDCDIIPGTFDPAAEVAIPGSCVEYEIEIDNVGSGEASDVLITNDLPASLIYQNATISNFGTLDPSFQFITPAPGTDCGSLSCELRLEKATLPSLETGTLLIRGILQ